MRRILVALITALAGLAVVTAGWMLSPLHNRLLPVGTGFTALQTCALHFVSGLSPDRARRLYLEPMLGAYAPLVHARVDAESAIVRASVFGLYERQAVHRPGLGCTLEDSGAPLDRTIDLARPAAPPAIVNAAHRDAHFQSDLLAQAVEFPFDYAAQNGRSPLAFVVLHQGELVAERYAEGIGPATPLLGWSTSKTALAAMAGAMVMAGEVDIHAPALESGATLDDLLRMASGYSQPDSHDPFSDLAVLLYLEPDMARTARQALNQAAPGDTWTYSSFNSVVAAQLINERIGGGLEAQARAWRERVFGPACMSTAIVQPDAAGTFFMGGYVFASAQDWARLGQVFHDDGRGCAGQVFEAGWVDHVTTPTPGSGGKYGAGVWLDRRYDFVPEDAFVMRGSQGQTIWIAPSHDLVVAHLGASTSYALESEAILGPVINALKAEP